MTIISPIQNPIIKTVFSPIDGPFDVSTLLFSAPNQTTAVLSKGTGDPTFVRATEATVLNFENVLRTVNIGEWRSKGARRVENLITASEDMTDAAYGVGNNAVIDSAIQATFDGTIDGSVNQVVAVDDSTGRKYTYSAKVRLVSGTISSDSALSFVIAGNASPAVIASIGDEVSATAKRFAVTATTDSGGGLMSPQIRWDDAGVLEITEWQLEEVTGQTNQNPGEYVSTGVESSPAYHGVMVDGVALFKYANGNTVSSNIVTEAQGAAFDATTNRWAVLPGAVGDYISTPDSVAASITSSIIPIAYVYADNWAPASIQYVISKWETGQEAYAFGIDAGGALKLFIYDGSVHSVASTSATGFTNGTGHWIMPIWNDATNVVNFYTSNDPESTDPLAVTWSLLGSADRALASSGINDTNAEVAVSGLNAGTAGAFAGKVSRAVIIAGTDPTAAPAVDFDPSKAVPNTSTFTSGGAVYTLNGNASIHFVPVDASGPFGGMSEPQRINLALHNRTFQDAVWAATTMTVADDSFAGIDGRTRAATLTATAGNATLIQDLGVIASSAKVGDIWIQRKTGTGTVELTLDGGSTWTAITVTAGWTRVEADQTVADPDFGIRIVTSGDEVYVDYAQVLDDSTHWSNTPETAGASVTVNADVLTYPATANILDAAGTAFAEVSSVWATNSAGAIYIAGRGAGAGRILYADNGSSNQVRIFDGAQSSIAPAGTSYENSPQKVASTWGDALTAYSSGALLPDLTPASYDGTMGSGSIGILHRGDGVSQWGGTGRFFQIFSDEKDAAGVALLPEAV